MKQRLATEKTRRETGLEYVFSSLNILTPYGKKALRNYEPFMPGSEDELRAELERIEQIRNILTGFGSKSALLREILMLVKDNSLSLEKSRNTTLSVVEIYEIKMLLLQMEKLRKMDDEGKFPAEFVPEDLTKLLDILDPDGGRVSTFFIYDSFSEELARLRKEKKTLEQQGRRIRKEKAAAVKKEYGIVLTPKFDIRVNKEDLDRIKMIKGIAGLEKSAEDYMSITWQLAADGEIDQIIKQKEACEELIEAEEFRVRRMLTAHIAGHAPMIEEGCRRIGRLDLAIAKADHAQKHDCVCPEVSKEHEIVFEEGRHIEVEEILKKEGERYCPISIELKDGVTCITGANMGGKTVSLKLAGLIPLMAQYGMFVPAKKARIGLSSGINILIGDSQSIERGLSSFGSEMEELKQMLDGSEPGAILLIDEIAAGTNPSEGLALTKSVIDYLKTRDYITLITTHYELGVGEDDINRLQVTGLGETDLDSLDAELHEVDSKGRIGVIRKHMDYRLRKATDGGDVPQDALNIARMLGIGSDIVDRAREYLR